MNLPDFSIRRPVTTMMICLIAILLGAIAFVEIPVDLMPEVVYPRLSSQASYAGVAPEEMETLVTRPLEEAFAAVPGVEEITSTSGEGSSSIRIGFSYGTDLDEAANELRTRLDRVRAQLPAEMAPPTIMKFDLAQFPIMFLTVSSDSMDQRELRHFVERSIQYRLERVPGVAQFDIRGGLRREIHVLLDLKKLRALNMSVAEVVRIIQSENLNRPVGPVREGRFDVLLRAHGEFTSMEEIRGIVVATRNGVPIHLRDVAEVQDTHEEITSVVTVDGRPAIRMTVNKQSGANTVKVSDAVWEEIDRINRDFPQITVSATNDTAEFIRTSITNLEQAAGLGAILAVLVLLFFLRSVASTLIIGTAIPIAVISTFALMYFNGFTLNTISFGGLALGVGMLVDNAIVVLENIYRHREAGESRMEAASKGSKEVGMAITASTLTTVAVFVPVVFITGMSGQQFKQLAWVISFALLASLIVALTIVPMLCSRYLPRPVDPKQRKGIGGVLDRAAAGIVDRLTDAYGATLSWAIGHRLSVVAGAVVLFACAVYLTPLIGVELQPQVDEGEIRVSVEMEPGTHVDVTDAVMQRLAAVVRERVPEAEHIQVEAGGANPFRGGGGSNGSLQLNLVPQEQRSRSSEEITAELRRVLQSEPGITISVRPGGGMFARISRVGSSEGDRLQVEIRGHDLNVLADLGDQVRERMSSVEGVSMAQISRRPGMPELVVEVDRAKASTMGLNVSGIAETMETAIGGRRASYFREEGDEYGILVRLREQDRLNISQVGEIPINTPSGQTVPAESVVTLKRQEGPVSIARADQQRIVVVSGTTGDRDLSAIVGDMQDQIRQMNIPEDYEVIIGGEWEEQQQAFRELLFAAILAIVLVYMVMASQFESLRDPFIILFSIPLALIGVAALLLITGTTFNIQGFLGIIVLVGIAVNNAIVLIDYTNLLRREYHVPLREAVLRAGRNRLRPILMTTITTVLGLLPMSLGIGEGGELQAPLARVIIGGLLTSTFITLIFIPIVYLILEERAERAEAAVAQPEPAMGD